MKRLGIIVLSITLCAMLFIYCGKEKETVEDPWKEFTSEEGGFSVLMPGEPTYSVQPAPTAQGSVQIHMYLLEHGVMAYGVMYNDVLGEIIDVQKFLDERRDAAVKTVSGSQVTEKSISIEGQPGREIKFNTADNIQYTGRLYLVDGRLYQVIATAPAGVNADAATAKLMDSFKILK